MHCTLQTQKKIFGAAVFSVAFVSLCGIQFVLGQDQTPPAISHVKVSDVATTSVVISWDTDEDADALIQVSTDKKYCTERSMERSKKHVITLRDLEPGTNYFFRSLSNDEIGNQNISEDYAFTTQGVAEIEKITEKITNQEERSAVEKILTELQIDMSEESLKILNEKLKEIEDESLQPPVIVGSPRVKTESDNALITWFTDRESTSMVAFATDAEYQSSGGAYTIQQGQPEEYVTSHEVRVIGLKPATTYHFQVISEPSAGPEAKSEDDIFVTKAIVPEIVGIRLEKVEDTSATISWRTTMPTAGSVEYTDLSTKESKSAGDPAFLTVHSVRLGDLALDTSYSAIVVAENELNEKIKSSPVTFRTVKDEIPPVIGKVINESTLYPGEEVRVQTIISWETDEVAYCQVKYFEGIGAGKDPQFFLEETNPLTKHVQVVTAFSPATVYKYWVECRDHANNKTRSEDFVMFTPQKEKSIIDVIIENFESSFGWVKKIGA